MNERMNEVYSARLSLEEISYINNTLLSSVSNVSRSEPVMPLTNGVLRNEVYPQVLPPLMGPCYKSLFHSIKILQSLWIVLTEQAVDKVTSRKRRDSPFSNRRATGRT
jgi:hypothetical protein